MSKSVLYLLAARVCVWSGQLALNCRSRKQVVCSPNSAKKCVEDSMHNGCSDGSNNKKKKKGSKGLVIMSQESGRRRRGVPKKKKRIS